MHPRDKEGGHPSANFLKPEPDQLGHAARSKLHHPIPTDFAGTVTQTTAVRAQPHPYPARSKSFHSSIGHAGGSNWRARIGIMDERSTGPETITLARSLKIQRNSIKTGNSNQSDADLFCIRHMGAKQIKTSLYLSTMTRNRQTINIEFKYSRHRYSNWTRPRYFPPINYHLKHEPSCTRAAGGLDRRQIFPARFRPNDHSIKHPHTASEAALCTRRANKNGYCDARVTGTVSNPSRSQCRRVWPWLFSPRG